MRVSNVKNEQASLVLNIILNRYYLGTNLVSTLSSLDVYNFTHFDKNLKTDLTNFRVRFGQNASSQKSRDCRWARLKCG